MTLLLLFIEADKESDGYDDEYTHEYIFTKGYSRNLDETELLSD